MKYTIKNIHFLSLVICWFCITGNILAQKPVFIKVGAYSYKDSQFSPHIVDGTWVRNNIFLCGYRYAEEFGITYKKPWIGVFDQASGKLVVEKAWESVGSFNKIISDDITGQVTVVTECYGQFFVARLDTALNVKQSFYTEKWNDVSFFGSIGKKGGYLAVMHEGDVTSDITDLKSIFRFKVIYFSSELKNTFESGYIDSTRMLVSMTDDYGNIIGVSRKLDPIDEVFNQYQIEIISLTEKNGINRNTIPWKLPTRQLNGNTYQLQVNKVHQIINPTAQGVGIVADVAFKNKEYPYYDLENKYTAYMYMESDGTIKESSLVKLVDPVKYDFRSTTACVVGNKVVLFTYLNDTDNQTQGIPGIGSVSGGKSELSIFNTSTQKIEFNANLETMDPLLKELAFSGVGDVDNYNITALFNDYTNYGFSSQVYYMLDWE